MGTAGVTGARLLVVLVLGHSNHLLSKFVFFFPWVAEAAGGRGSPNIVVTVGGWIFGRQKRGCVWLFFPTVWIVRGIGRWEYKPFQPGCNHFGIDVEPIELLVGANSRLPAMPFGGMRVVERETAAGTVPSVYMRRL